MKEISKLIFELGMLKRVKRSGWWIAAVKDPESVAEHSFRVAAIAYILAKLEKENAEKICSAAVFHDCLETRLTDVNKIMARYIDTKEAKERITKDQMANLPIQIDFVLTEKEKLILKDADLLEMFFQAKEYVEIGYKECADWINESEKRLTTKSAKEILKEMKNMNSCEWWKGLKKLE
ncbi:MAG: HD domain-containing protein [Candidatus Micrarchaeota archaeon]